MLLHMGACGLLCLCVWWGGVVTDCGPTDHRQPQETGGGGMGGVALWSGQNMEQRVLLSNFSLCPEQQPSEMKTCKSREVTS